MAIRLMSACSAAMMLAATSVAAADGPVRLTDVELDRVAAGDACDFCFSKRYTGVVSLQIASKIDEYGKPHARVHLVVYKDLSTGD